jgi:hypothetical protein
LIWSSIDQCCIFSLLQLLEVNLSSFQMVDIIVWIQVQQTIITNEMKSLSFQCQWVTFKLQNDIFASSPQWALYRQLPSSNCWLILNKQESLHIKRTNQFQQWDFKSCFVEEGTPILSKIATEVTLRSFILKKSLLQSQQNWWGNDDAFWRMWKQPTMLWLKINSSWNIKIGARCRKLRLSRFELH